MKYRTLAERLAALEARRRVAAGCDAEGRPLYVRCIVVEGDDDTPPIIIPAFDARGRRTLTAAGLAAVQADHLSRWQSEREARP